MARRSKQAYYLVNLEAIPAEAMAVLLEDANLGGADYGLRIVETMLNGPAAQPIYGVYYNTPESNDEDRWAAAKVQFGISDDADVRADPGAIRRSADSRAAAAAAAVQELEDDEVMKVTKAERDEEQKNFVRDRDAVQHERGGPTPAEVAPEPNVDPEQAGKNGGKKK